MSNDRIAQLRKVLTQKTVVDGITLVSDEEMKSCCRLIEDEYFDRMVNEIAPDIEEDDDEEEEDLDPVTLCDQISLQARWRMLNDMGVDYENIGIDE